MEKFKNRVYKIADDYDKELVAIFKNMNDAIYWASERPYPTVVESDGEKEEKDED